MSPLPTQKQYYREQFAQIAVYGDSLLSVTLREGKPLTAFVCLDEPL